MYRADLLSHDDERATFEIECSAGTYIRTLVVDLDDAYCESLRRTAIGPFDVGPTRATFVPPRLDALAFMPEVRLGPDEARASLATGSRSPGEGGRRRAARATPTA